MSVANGSAKSLVDMQSGEISRELFVNADLYQKEQAQVFARAWLFVGHESQVPLVGDYIVSKMGEESVILTRDQHNKLNVFLNTCRHRGMKVCRYDEGSTRHFTCPYHGWTYDLDGTLINVADFENAYQPPFDRQEWGLHRVAQLANFRGFIFATWDKQAPSFDEYLGEAKFGLAAAVSPWDGGDGETELLGSTQRWLIPSNWKLVAENFSGDVAHDVSHRSVDMTGIGPRAGAGRRDDPGRFTLAGYPGGHGINFGMIDVTKPRNDYSASPATAAYFRQCWEKRIARFGEAAGPGPIVGTIFPNMSFHGQQPRTILVAHPRGPLHTEMWRVYFVDKEAPLEVKEYLRSYYIRYSGPAGLTEQDDMENWYYATAASQGVIARQFPYNYKAGLGVATSHRLVPGVITQQPATSEQNPRNLYWRWAEFMDASSWAELHVLGGR